MGYKKREKRMRICISKTVMIVLCAGILFGMLKASEVYAKTSNKSACIVGNFNKEFDERIKTKDEAKEIAMNFVRTVIKNCSQETNWDEETSIGNCRELYGADGEISAFCVELTSVNDDNGYVVVGVDASQPPIIEYSLSGSFCVDDKSDVYYFGDNDYYIKNEFNFDEAQYINTNSKIRLYENDVKKIEENTSGDYSHEWDLIETKDDLECKESVKYSVVGNSSRLMSTEPILNPYEYETGYGSVAPIDVNKWNNYYFSTADFQGYNSHCAPTAATNLIRYWFLRNNSKYAPLIRDWQWWQIFGNMYIFMKTDDSGTSEDNIYKGLKKYLKNMGLSSEGVKWLPDPDFNDVVNELDNGKGGRPFLYCVYQHTMYGNHCMLALGYMEFGYKNDKYFSRYIRVADGWNNYADRFVHFKIGQNASLRGMITFKPIV